MTAPLIDYAKALAYTKWINSIIGEQPQIVRRDDGTLFVDFTEQQQQKMHAWLDKQVFKAARPTDEKANVEYGIGNIVVPWSMRYIIPASIVIFLFGKILGR